MSYLLFIDESGHDHKHTPYEVRGGVAIDSKRLWPFIRAMSSLEQSAFGCFLHQYHAEIKGRNLLSRDAFRFAKQDALLDDEARRKYSVSFLNRNIEHRKVSRIEFTAYGQACLMMARGIFELLASHGAALFAAAIPQDVRKPATVNTAEFLRKDHVFLLERYFYFLEEKKEEGLLVLDESEKVLDRQFVSRMYRYFTLTETGRYRAARIIPAPMFVSSDMVYGIQAADICIYCINWGYRLSTQGMNAAVRPEIQTEFGPWLDRLQFKGEGYRAGQTYKSYGVVYVPDPYTRRT